MTSLPLGPHHPPPPPGHDAAAAANLTLAVPPRAEMADNKQTSVVGKSEQVTGHVISTTIGGKNGELKKTISYMAERVVGTGSFGIVFQAKCLETGEAVAIKKVLQDKRYKNRELQLMRSMDHPNVIPLKHCFFSTTSRDELFLNLVMEYVPETLYGVLRHFSNGNQRMPLIYVKLYTYQIFSGLAYIHTVPGVCHRDVKPQNILVDPLTHQVKLCDFGSAKVLVKGEANISYICSRYYRAPELIFGATEYTTSIDIWSAGCVLAELLLGQPLFPGASAVDQLVQIIKVLGTPTREEIRCMNPSYTEFRFPQIKEKHRMGGGGASTETANPKPSPLNPNWAQLQQKLKSRRPPKPSHSADPGARTLAPSVLGKRKERAEPAPEASPSAFLSPTSTDCSLTDALAMDCEMVGVSIEGSKSAVGRVTLVNSWGNVVYDEYVRPIERIVDFRTKISGIRPRNMRKAKEFWAVQKQVAELIKGRILVGHALHNDLKVLLLSHPKKDIRDTSEYEPLRRGGQKRALKHLAAEILGAKIQENEHCPIEDARAAMFIYNKYKKAWEKSMKKNFMFKEKLNKRKKKQMEAKKS